ncbi:MAG: hypothetical protein ACE5QW_06120 [Thermoplasmata archaeon]
MEHNLESFPGFGFVEQEIDDNIKLQILFAELNRLERTMEIHGNPYVFVDDEKVRFSIDSGKRRFENHRNRLKDILCGESWSNPNSRDRCELLRSILDRISYMNVHPYILLILAQIIAVNGLESFCSDV